jgi:carnitine O-acetyltransferase
MSAVRSFTTIPNSISSTLAAARYPQTNGFKVKMERSEEAARETTQSFPKDEKAPLAAHQNPQSKPGITFAAQDSLPKLPIPDLEATCKRYLEALKPLQSFKEHENTERAVQDFLRGEGPELQEKLRKYAADKPSYIEQFCQFCPTDLRS